MCMVRQRMTVRRILTMVLVVATTVLQRELSGAIVPLRRRRYSIIARDDTGALAASRPCRLDHARQPSARPAAKRAAQTS